MVELVVFGAFAVVLAVVPSLIKRLDQRTRQETVRELFRVDECGADECGEVLVARRPTA